MTTGKWIICPECEGDGTTAKHLGVVNQESGDEEFFEDYMAGRFDRICDCCKGSGKIREGNVGAYYAEESDRREAYRLQCAEDGRRFDWY